MEEQNSHINRIRNAGLRGYQMQPMAYFNRAINLVKMHWGPFAVYTLIYFSFLFLVYRLGENGSFLQLLLSGPLNAGYYLSIHRLVNNAPFRFENFFDGFRIYFATMAVGMVSMFLTSLGMMLFILPGLLISLSLIFSLPLVVFAELDLINALRSSTQIVWKQFWDMAKFGGMIFVLNIAGAMALGIGLLFTLPVTFAAIYFAYDDIIGINVEQEEPAKTDLSHFR